MKRLMVVQCPSVYFVDECLWGVSHGGHHDHAPDGSWKCIVRCEEPAEQRRHQHHGLMPGGGYHSVAWEGPPDRVVFPYGWAR